LNQIRQIGLAILNFEASRRGLPPGGYVSKLIPTTNNSCERSFNIGVSDCFDAFGANGGLTYSWVVMILPFMEESALYDQFDFKTRVYELPNAPYSRTISGLICPTDDAAGRRYDGTQTPVHGMGKSFAKGNYAGYVSPVHINMQRILPAAFGGFTPGDSVGQRLSRIKDGTTNTISLTEVRTLDRAWDSRGTWALPFPGAALLGLDWHPVNNDVVAPYRPNPNYDIRWVQTPNRQALIVDQLIACSQPIYAKERRMPCQAAQYLSCAPRSLHLGGVNAVALDGHAGFISDDIDSFIFTYLISANDGQVSNVGEFLK
jgi:hypothetical protein